MTFSAFEYKKRTLTSFFSYFSDNHFHIESFVFDIIGSFKNYSTRKMTFFDPSPATNPSYIKIYYIFHNPLTTISFHKNGKLYHETEAIFFIYTAA